MSTLLNNNGDEGVLSELERFIVSTPPASPNRDPLLNGLRPFSSLSSEHQKCVLLNAFDMPKADENLYPAFSSISPETVMKELRVMNAKGPDKFTLSEPGRIELDKLEKDLNDLYGSREGSTFRLWLKDISYKDPQRRHILVAAHYSQKTSWRRCKLLIPSCEEGESTLGKVLVYFIDYGEEGWVGEETLRLLAKRFWKIPAQAVEGHLANLQTEKWTQHKIEQFKKETEGKTMVVFIQNIHLNEEIPWIEVKLYNDDDQHRGNRYLSTNRLLM